jgi:hypothetical protein
VLKCTIKPLAHVCFQKKQLAGKCGKITMLKTAKKKPKIKTGLD